MAAIENASLQPAPAIIKRCSSLLAFKIARYSFTSTFSCVLLTPKYSGRSFSQIPTTASSVRSADTTIASGIITLKNSALLYPPSLLLRIGAKNCTSPIPIRLATVLKIVNNGLCLGSLVRQVCPERVHAV